MILTTSQGLAERRAIAAPGGPLAGLFDSLSRELEPLLDRPLYIPEQKALLSREGGRCAHDGTVLEFDPASPRVHRCPACGRNHEGELHHRAWITWYQLWLAERAVHAALFHALRGEERHAKLAAGILGGYADRYLGYPNVDNVLGPSRLFFSTYLESIWLLQLCIATELLGDRAGALAGRVRERIVEPARQMIGEFDEGRSNRQVWNNAAMLAAASLCGDDRASRSAVHGSSGLVAHLDGALLADGSWYEGENYHQFALRGLWYGVVLAEGSGAEIPAHLRDRFHRAFAMPFATALPDFTMPSRKDSQYAVSLRQWRLAELAELGYARTRSPELAGALARCYEPGHERRDTGRSRSAADAERNTPSGALTRSDLSWRALLFAAPELPRATATQPRSAHLVAQGYAVFRRENDVYVGYDYGQSGGGHGHPDRLNLTLYQGSVRWLDDLGTGSYVDRSLHWYRSTLAHNAPLVNAQSQPMLDGELRAHDEREGMGWIAARLTLPSSETWLERAIVVATDYMVDELTWNSGSAPEQIDLPLHLDGTVRVGLRPAKLEGGSGREDGFEFVSDARSAHVPAGQAVRVDAERDGRRIAAHVVCTTDATLFHAMAPGQPATVRRPFFLLRARSDHGRIRSVIAWDPSLSVRHVDDVIHVSCESGERHLHRRDESGWHVELHAGGARSSIDLAGFVPASTRPTPSPPAARVHTLRRGETLRYALGREHYRRSESSWEEGGAPSASIEITREEPGLLVVVHVRAGEALFAPASAVNEFDNEHPDTMGAGVQLYLHAGEHRGSWALVPDGESVRVRLIEPPSGVSAPTASWEAMPGGGYQLRARVPLPKAALDGESFSMDLYVNETVRGRSRRRGQLVLTGAAGEWVYLRGDRHTEGRWLTLRFT